MKMNVSDVKTSKQAIAAIEILSESLATDEKLKVESDLVILVLNSNNYMCVKVADMPDRYTNVFSYTYTTNEITSLDGMVGILLEPDHIVKISPDIEIVQSAYAANMILVYLSALKELLIKRGL